MRTIELITGTKELTFDRPVVMDVSGWQSYPNTEYGTNFELAKSRGIVGAKIRAGSCTADNGTLYSDYDLLPNVQLSNTMVDTFPRWFYWYARPRWGGKRQALKMLEYLDDAGAGDAFTGLIGDFENFDGVTKAQASSEMDQFMEVLRYYFPNKEHEIYCSGLKWNQYAAYCKWASYFNLWIAIYPDDVNTYTNPWQNPKYKPITWDSWTFWQFTDKGDGRYYGTESAQVDLNFFNGTYEEFYEYCDVPIDSGVPQPEPPAVVGEPLQYVKVTTILGLNLRPTPDTTGKPLGALLRGAVVPIYAFSGPWGMVADGVWIHTQYTITL